MIDKRIISFFRKHHVLTISTSVNNEPWCANCFYVYLAGENSLVFTTDPETRHGKEFLINRIVAGSVVLETPVIGKITGYSVSGYSVRAGGGYGRNSPEGLSHEVSGCNADGNPFVDS